MARTYRDMIRVLLKINGIKTRDVRTFHMDGKSPFEVGSDEEYFRVTIELSKYVTLSDLNKISRLLGTEDIEITSTSDFDDAIIEVDASHVDRDNIKIQLIYAESFRG